MSKEIMVLFAITFFLPYAEAGVLPANCSHLTESLAVDCSVILGDSMLSVEEKEDLYLNILADQGELGSFGFAWNFNEGIAWNGNPNSAVPVSDGVIRNAWVKIVGVSRSYFDLNKSEWFVSPVGQVLTEHNYRVEVPSGTLSGDCATYYELEYENAVFRVRLNGFDLGTNRISNYGVSEVNGLRVSFEGTLTVNTRLKIVHYAERLYKPFPWEWSWYTLCEYDRTSYQNNQVSVSDFFVAKTSVQNIEVETFVEENEGLSKLFVFVESGEPINFFGLSAGGSSFGCSETFFDLSSTDRETIFVSKNYEKTCKSRGFVVFDLNNFEGVRSFVLGAVSLENCFYTAITDFDEFAVPCNLIKLKEPVLVVETDSNSYDFGETVNASVLLLSENGLPLTGKRVVLRAGENNLIINTGFDGTALFSFPAQNSFGLITATFEGDKEYRSAEAVKRFALTKKDSADLGIDATIFFGAYYFVFLIGKKFLTGVL
jgi:hypothetical protein